MADDERPVAVGEQVPEVVLETADGQPFHLSALGGRPLLAVCVRYYG